MMIFSQWKVAFNFLSKYLRSFGTKTKTNFDATRPVFGDQGRLRGALKWMPRTPGRAGATSGSVTYSRSWLPASLRPSPFPSTSPRPECKFKVWSGTSVTNCDLRPFWGQFQMVSLFFPRSGSDVHTRPAGWDYRWDPQNHKKHLTWQGNHWKDAKENV